MEGCNVCEEGGGGSGEEILDAGGGVETECCVVVEEGDGFRVEGFADEVEGGEGCAPGGGEAVGAGVGAWEG